MPYNAECIWQISGLSKTYEVLHVDRELATKALKLAEEAATFIRLHLYDQASGTLRRSYREGQGPIGQADDYAFFIQGECLMGRLVVRLALSVITPNR